MDGTILFVFGWSGALLLGCYLGAAAHAFRKSTAVDADPAPELHGFHPPDWALRGSPPYPADALERADEAYADLNDEDALAHLDFMRSSGSLIVRDELLPPAARHVHVTLRVDADAPISPARSRMLASLVMQAIEEAEELPHDGAVVVAEPTGEPSPAPAYPEAPRRTRVRALDL